MITRLKLLCVALFWGGTFAAGHVIGAFLPATVSAVARFGIASVMLLGFAWWMEGGLPRLDRRMALVTLGLGFIGIFAYNSFFFAAVQMLPASRTATIVALNPICTALLNAMVTRKRLDLWSWIGIVLSFAGALLVIAHGNPATLLAGGLGRGESIMLAGVVSWALYTVLGTRALHGISSIAATTYAALCGTAMLALYAVPDMAEVDWAHLPAQAWWCLAYLGIPGTAIAYVWYFEGVQRLGAPRAAVFNSFVPVFGVALSALILHERPPLSTLVGGFIVLSGVLLTNRSREQAG